MNQQKFYLLIFSQAIFLNGIIICVVSPSEMAISSTKQQVFDSAQATSAYPRLNSASASVPHYGTHSSAHPHLGQPHHFRHHNNPNLKITSAGSLSSSPEHVNPHQVPELLEHPLLLDKSNIKASADSATGQVPHNHHLKSASSSASTIDVDSFVPPGYDKLMPPKENGKPTIVRFHVWILSLDSIDEGSMTYVADIFISQSWKDNRLIIPQNITFNGNVSANNDPRGPYRLLPVTLIDKIWRPDSFFKNAKEVTFQEMTIPNHYIWLYEDHTILYMVKLSLLLSCAMKFQTYPHDTQNCTMKIESLSYTTNDLIFDWEESDPLVVEKNIELPQHDLIKKEIDYCTTTYSSGTFACVQVLFTIKRRLGYYIFHTYIPTCLIVIMSWISFWIKPEAVPARVTLCVTSLLTLSTQHAQSQKSLPPVSYIKAIDIFMSSCTVFVFASLMEYALVNILMSDELLNGWIGIMGEATGPLQAAAAAATTTGSSASPQHVPGTPQTATAMNLMQSRPSPLIYTQSVSPPACEVCCSARQSTSSEAANDGEEDEEDSLENDATEEGDEQASDIHLGRMAMPKLNATSVSLLPADSLQHRASFQCLTELTANATNRNFDPYGTSVFKLNSLNVKQPKIANRPPNNILSNRKNPKLSGHSKSSTLNLALNDHGKSTRMRRLSQSFSLLKMINQPKPEKFGSAMPCQASSASTSPPHHHHAHFCPQSQYHESAALHFRHSSQQSRPFGRLLHYTNSSASDTCFHQHHQHQHQHHQAPAGIALQSAGCCGSGSTTNGFGGTTTAGSATGGGKNHHHHHHRTASSYQQKKHMRAYVVDEISRWIFPLSFIMLNIVYWAYYLNLMDSLPEFSQN